MFGPHSKQFRLSRHDSRPILAYFGHFGQFRPSTDTTQFQPNLPSLARISPNRSKSKPSWRELESSRSKSVKKRKENQLRSRIDVRVVAFVAAPRIRLRCGTLPAAWCFLGSNPKQINFIYIKCTKNHDKKKNNSNRLYVCLRIIQYTYLS